MILRKIIQIDYIRTLAIFLVVLCHSVEEGVYHFSLSFMTNIPTKSAIFAHFIFSLGRLGVPFFIMISGFLLLPRDYDKEKCVYFWKNNFIKLLITFEIWVFLYRCFGFLILHWPFDLKALLKEMLLVKSVELSHIWYMPMILGVYLFLPIIAGAIKLLEYRKIFILIVITSVFLFLIPTINILFTINGIDPLLQQIDLSFSGGIYGIYLIMGYLINKRFFSNISSVFLYFNFTISFFFVVIMQYCAYRRGIAYNVWYDNFFILTSSVCIMELLVRRDFKENMIISTIAKYSFAIYLIHICFKPILLPYINIIFNHRSKEVLFLWIAMFVCSFISSIILNQIPGIGRTLFYIKEKHK